MSKPIALNWSDAAPLAAVAHPDYSGRIAYVRTESDFCYTAAQLSWCDGYKTDVVAMRQAPSGAWVVVPMTTVSPMSGDVFAGKLDDATMLVERRHGRTGSVTFVVSPTSRFLPAGRLAAPAPELTAAERFVLDCLVGLTSAGRKDAYARCEYRASEIAAATDGLVAKGLAKKNSLGHASATVAGKNARNAA